MSDARRTFHPFEESTGKEYASNSIRTTKYTVGTFVFLNLWEQFHKVANIYFLIISILQFIPIVSSVSPTTWFPLALVLLTNMIKEAIEDSKRSRTDRVVNNSRVSIVDASSGNVREQAWSELKVGGVVLLKDGDRLPADVIVLSSSKREDGLCQIETSELDGETNLKSQEAVESTHRQVHEHSGSGKQLPTGVLGAWKALTVETEAPNANLHSFQGRIQASGMPDAGLTNKQIIYRGCSVRNTEWTYCVVIFTGRETKLMQNATGKTFKRTTLDKLTNRYLIFIFCLLIFLCVVGGIASAVWITNNDDPTPWYLDELDSAVKGGLLRIFTFLILMSALIPISLTVSMELVKVGHSYFINADPAMRWTDPITGKMTRANARTSNLSEDLGRIQYIFSDKTGTLTQNVMEFMKCSVGGNSYGSGTTEIGRAAAAREGRQLVEDVRPPDFHPMRGDNFYDQRVSKGAWSQQANTALLDRFFTHLAVCHTVESKPKVGKEEVESNWTRENVAYQASSPDEEALVIGARGSGFWFKRRTFRTVYMEVDSGGPQPETRIYNMLQVNEFNSTRKRMSCIMEMPDGRLVLMCKGADSVILERATPEDNNHATLKDHLRSFAGEGLRTLLFSEREITREEHRRWVEKYDAARTSPDRDDALDAVAEEIEHSLTIVGASAIEDKLQDGVPACIKTLAEAKIQIWVLTGDKVETAINIAMACNLINLSMRLERVTLPDRLTPDEEGDKRYVIDTLKKASSPSNFPPGQFTETALVIDGGALKYALEREEQSKKDSLELLEFSEKCKSVVCCRVSPAQKGSVVQLVRNKKQVITLAIGDGANDVNMILKAHIGIGLSGREGVQAEQNSDYSFAQFRFLQQLILVHGRWDFQRISLLIVYSFYKNIGFAVVTFWFGIFSAFSGVKYWNDILQALWNVIFTSVPIMVVSLFDKDFVYQATLHEFPELYETVQSGSDFTLARFVWWVLDSLWYSLVVFFVPLYVFEPVFDVSDGRDNGKWLLSLTSFLSTCTVVNLRLAIVTRTWTIWNLVGIAGSILSAFVFAFLYSLFPPEWAKENTGLFARAFENGAFWGAFVASVVLSLLPSFAVRSFKWLVFPTRAMLVGAFEASILNEQADIYRVMPDDVWGRVLHLIRTKHKMAEEKNTQYLEKMDQQATGIHPAERRVMWTSPEGAEEEHFGYAFAQQRGGDPGVLRSYYS